MFYGRKAELDIMNERFKADRKQFGVIYGRKKIGKTYMTEKFMEEKDGVYFHAISSNDYENLRIFSSLIAAFHNLPQSYVYPSWQIAFDDMEAYFSGRRYCFIIDDYPFVASQAGGFASMLQSLFDGAKDNLFLVIIGDDEGYMKKVIHDYSAPLYRRQTFELCLETLPLSEALSFLVDFSSESRLSYLELMSGHPYYLSRLDAGKSFDDNVTDLLFDEDGPFFDLSEKLLTGVADVQNVYNAIIYAVAKGASSIQDISRYIHETPSKVCKYMNVLTENGIMRMADTFNGNMKTHYYVIADPLVRFWYRFVFADREIIRGRAGRLYDEKREVIRDFLDRAFEDVAVMYLDEINSAGRLGDIFPPVRKYVGRDAKRGGFTEISGLSQSGNNLLVFDCSCDRYPYINARLERLKESVSAMYEGVKAKISFKYCLFSRSGFGDDMEDSSEVFRFTPEDIVALRQA